MTESQKLQNELNEFNAKRAAFKAEQEVIINDFPKMNRSYTYRKSPAIKAQDVCSL